MNSVLLEADARTPPFFCSLRAATRTACFVAQPVYKTRAASMPVTQMNPAELEAVAELASLTGFVVEVGDELHRPWARMWVARRDAAVSAVEAFALTWLAADELHVIALGTHPSCRRQGLARSLIGRIIEDAREHSARLIILEVRESNVPARRLYEGFGFAESRLRRRYYQDPEEDGIELMLAASPSEPGWPGSPGGLESEVSA